MNKEKLTISEQITDMKNKGVTFNYTNEENAIHFLKYNNYYFKLKSYGKNYSKYNATEKKGSTYIWIFLTYKNFLHWICIYEKSFSL